MTKTLKILFVFFLLASSFADAQTVFLKQPQDSVKHRKVKTSEFIKVLRNDIDGLIANNDFSNAFVGISVKSMENDEYLYNFNHLLNFIPASTNKLITTSAALVYLGPEFKFTTSLYLDGKLGENGEFEGNLIVRGLGDPTLSAYFYYNPFSFIENWVTKLDSIGIKSIRGNIIADDRYFDNVYYPSGWALDDLAYTYSPQIDALTINDNKVDIYLTPGVKEGERAKYRVEPYNNYVRVINGVKTVSPNNSSEFYASRELKTNIVELTGSLAYDSTKTEESKISVTIDNPSIFFLSFLKQTLDKSNIRFRGALVNINDLNDKFSYSNKIPFCTQTSPPLKEIVSVVNRRSHNLIAEMLLKTIAKETTGEGSFSKGIEKIRTYFARMGIPPDFMNYVDGSGLSRLNFISPSHQVSLLSNIYFSEYKEIILNSLAVPGKEGTLKNRLTSSRAEKNVFAKTGSMNGVSNICGYIRTRDNEYLAFSIMMNNFSVPERVAQNLQDLIIMRLASFSRKMSEASSEN